MREALERARLVAIRATVGGARPLTRTEIRRNIDWLMESRPDASDREIARLLGVANSTVSRRRLAAAQPASDPTTGEARTLEIDAQRLAMRLFKGLEKVGETPDASLAFFFGGRIAATLADLLTDAYGEDAFERAQQYQGWISAAVGYLTEP